MRHHELALDCSYLCSHYIHATTPILFHPAHIEKNIDGVNVADALGNVVRYAQSRGMEWMTNREINDWERKRRGVRLRDLDLSGEAVYDFITDRKLEDATLLFLVPDGVSGLNISKEGVPLEKRDKSIYGFDWAEVITDLEGRESIEIAIE